MVREIIPKVRCNGGHPMKLVCCNSTGDVLFYQCFGCDEVIKIELVSEGV